MAIINNYYYLSYVTSQSDKIENLTIFASNPDDAYTKAKEELKRKFDEDKFSIKNIVKGGETKSQAFFLDL